MVMHFTETAPQQSEHVEWINAFGQFQSCLDAIQLELNEISHLINGASRTELVLFEEKIQELRNDVYELSYAVSEHMDEAETLAFTDNRLDLDFQVVQHISLRDRFLALEEDFHALRDAFNIFQSRFREPIDGIPQIFA
jgi:hypothetical protein